MRGAVLQSLALALWRDRGALVMSFALPVIVFVIFAAIEANALIGPGKPSQKPLTTVQGAIHLGLGLWLVLYIVGAALNS